MANQYSSYSSTGTMGGGGGGAVSSVNGQTGAVVLTAQDVLPTQTGNAGKFLTTDGSVASWALVSASPGGSDTQIQFNDGGAFGGDSGLLYLKTLKQFIHGQTSTAAGDHGFAVNSSAATGDYSSAFNSSASNGIYSFSTGFSTNASGTSSTAHGSSTTASGGSSLSSGLSSIASGNASLSAGRSTVAQADYQTAVGQFNVALGTPGAPADADEIFTVGVGPDGANRTSGFAVRRDGFVFIEGAPVNGFSYFATRDQIGTSLDSQELDIATGNADGAGNVSGALYRYTGQSSTASSGGIFDSTGGGDTGSGDIQQVSGDVSGTGSSGNLVYKSGNTVDGNSGSLLYLSGTADGAFFSGDYLAGTGAGIGSSSRSGSSTLTTGNTINNSSGGTFLRTGNSSGADSGDITLQTGTASTTRGLITLNARLITASAPIVLPNYTVATLPSASGSGSGATAFVTDASTTIILGLGLTVAGGGANKVPVYSDGTNWIVG